VDGGDKERMPVDLTISSSKGKPLYLFDIKLAGAFVKNMAEHDKLEVWIPYRKHDRPVKTRFGLKNALRSLNTAAQECGIKTSQISHLIAKE